MKSKWKSRTLWFNGSLSFLLSVIAIVQTYLPIMGLEVSREAVIMMCLAIAALLINILLRLVTKDALK